MLKLYSIFVYTLKEHLRRKALLVVCLFGLILLAGAVVVSTLAQQERARMILDMGLAASELIGLVLAVFSSVMLVLQEAESRTVHLILAHPIRRSHYVLGRYFGALAAVVGAMALMAILHAAMLCLYGWHDLGVCALAWLCSSGKVALMGALALLLSLALTSADAAMAFSGFLWMLGHFTEELRFLAERSGNGVLRAAILAAAYAAPNFSYFDYRDFWRAGSAPGAAWYLWLALYAIAYTATMLALSCQLFAHKEL